MLSGPIWTVKEKGSERTRTVAGFLFSAEGRMVEDGSPSAVGEWRANDDVIESIRTNPLKLVQNSSGAIIYQNTDYLHSDAFQNYKTRANAGSKGINVAGKIDISVITSYSIHYTKLYEVCYHYNQVFRQK